MVADRGEVESYELYEVAKSERGSRGNSKTRTVVNGWERVKGSEDLGDRVSSIAVVGGGGSCE